MVGIIYLGKKFQLDVWYVDNWTCALDLKILLLTLKTVIKRDGVDNSESVSMPKFTGRSS